MKIEELKALCRQQQGVIETHYAAPSNILVYAIREKKFAYFKTSTPEQWRFSLRVTPDRFLELTDQPGIKPARYMGRFHWVTIVDVSAMDEGYLHELLKDSYAMALRSLPKTVQRALMAGKDNGR